MHRSLPFWWCLRTYNLSGHVPSSRCFAPVPFPWGAKAKTYAKQCPGIAAVHLHELQMPRLIVGVNAVAHYSKLNSTTKADANRLPGIANVLPYELQMPRLVVGVIIQVWTALMCLTVFCSQVDCLVVLR